MKMHDILDVKRQIFQLMLGFLDVALGRLHTLLTGFDAGTQVPDFRRRFADLWTARFGDRASKI